MLLAVALWEGSIHGLYMHLLLSQVPLHILDLFSNGKPLWRGLKWEKSGHFLPQVGNLHFLAGGLLACPLYLQENKRALAHTVFYPNLLSPGLSVSPGPLLALCSGRASLTFRNNHVLHSQTSGLRQAQENCQSLWAEGRAWLIPGHRRALPYPCSGLAFICVCVGGWGGELLWNNLSWG